MMNHAMMAAQMHQNMVNNFQFQQNIQIHQQITQEHIRMHQQMMQHQQHSASTSTTSSKRVTKEERIVS